MKQTLFIVASLLFLLSCTRDRSGDFPLENGLYTCEVEDGTICVMIFDDLKCDIYFEGYEDFDIWKTYHGSISYDYREGGIGSIFSIKGYAHRPYDDQKSIDPSSFFYHWQYNYTFTNSSGAILSETSFQYFLKTQRPWHDDKTINVVFTKR